MMESPLIPIFGMLIPIVFFITLFSFLAVASRSDARRRESEAREKYEFLRKMAEGGSFDVQKYVQYEEANLRLQRRRRIENLNLAGLVLAAVGAAAMPFFYLVADPELWTLGLCPLLIGAALFGAARWMARSPS